MNQSFYVGAVGAWQQQQRLNIQGNNIANVNTYGFKAEKGRFTNLIYQNLTGIDGEQLPVGVGAKLLMSSTDFSTGGVTTTDRPLDYMIEGDGFFGLVDMSTGEISFTRNGAFSMAEYQRPTGRVDADGNPVMESVYCLSDGEGRFVLNKNGGLIEVTDPNDQLDVGVFDYQNYDGMLHLDSTRFQAVDKNGGLRLGTGVVHKGALETSNVDLAEEMAKVIESQRSYSMALKMVQTSDEVETTINGLRA
ncbi:MAG: flagellar hook-basal body protein [Acutalibacter sp.]|jgi:flagellar basal-body rod protein FlgG